MDGEVPGEWGRLPGRWFPRFVEIFLRTWIMWSFFWPSLPKRLLQRSDPSAKVFLQILWSSWWHLKSKQTVIFLKCYELHLISRPCYFYWFKASDFSFLFFKNQPLECIVLDLEALKPLVFTASVFLYNWKLNTCCFLKSVFFFFPSVVVPCYFKNEYSTGNFNSVVLAPKNVTQSCSFSFS